MSDSLGDVVTGSCMLPDMGLGSQLSPQEEQCVLLTTKPSLQSQEITVLVDGFLRQASLFYNSDSPETGYVNQADLKFAELHLPLTPKSWAGMCHQPPSFF